MEESDDCKILPFALAQFRPIRRPRRKPLGTWEYSTEQLSHLKLVSESQSDQTEEETD